MKIFLSYPSAHKDTAASICYELQAEGHDVFFDKEDLPAGQSYNAKIRAAIDVSDLVIFLITPDAVAPGRYTLTELKLTRLKWPNPDGHLLPVMLEPTPFEDIPPYLGAVTVLTPEGNVAAEILMEITHLEAAPISAPAAPPPDRHALEVYRYHPVEIRFGAGGTGTYPLAVTESPTGRWPSAPCPVDPRTLESALWSSGGTVSGVVRRDRRGPGEAPQSLLPSAQDAKHVGQELYALLFNSHIRPCLDRSLRSVDPQRREGLRFLINTTEAPDLARLPWEFLYSPEQDDFLFSNQMTPLIRWLDVDQPPPTLAVEPPLRLLMAVAAPRNRPDLSVGDEIAHLDDALGDLVAEGRVNVVRLDHTTLEGLDEALLREKPHVLHFIGHGDFVANEGVVVLESQSPGGEADPISGRRLGVLLRNHIGYLRFVFLNSCLGARASRRDSFGGVAQSLIRRGIPAVIAMQFPIPDRVAAVLARHFYRYLATGLPVDAALTSARAFLFARGHEVEWGAPTLHMRTPDGRLFEVGEQAPPDETAPLPAPAVTTPRRGDDRATERPEKAPPVPGPSRSRSGVWKWIVLALLAGLTALAAFWWSGKGTQDAGPPPSVSLPDPGAPARPEPLPPMPPPAALKPPAVLPSPAPAPAPSARQDRERYIGVLDHLKRGDAITALAGLNAAMQVDPEGARLAEFPDLRDRIFDGFLALGASQLPLEALWDALTWLDPDRAAILIETLASEAEMSKEIAPETGLPPAAGGAAAYHRVSPGDTLWDIAASRLGDPTRWPQIYAANRDAIQDPDLIYPGQQFTMPTLGEYRVIKGDSLWKIAARAYGDPTRWPQIYAANRDIIRDPHLIFPDQRFIIPQDDPVTQP